MIVVTGGAGFIGSRLIGALNGRGLTDILVVDHLGRNEKWRNLLSLKYTDYLDREPFLKLLEGGGLDSRVEALFHLGACSDTTQRDAAYLMENNYRYTLRLASWWEKNRECRFVYASSAATYGDGSQGYDDDEAGLDRLRPLNAYGYSKHLFDLAASRRGWLKGVVGLKYFNVFGPNESHKRSMRSLVCKSWGQVRQEGVMRLFESHRPEFGHGEQIRDFIYVDDAVAMTLYFLDRPRLRGLYNIGTGQGRTWNDLARAVFAALELPPRIEYIPMPRELRPNYQYYTQARLEKLRRAGCDHQCLSLEESVNKYIKGHLLAGKG